MSVTIAMETPLQDEVRTLVSELNAVLLKLPSPAPLSLPKIDAAMTSVCR